MGLVQAFPQPRDTRKGRRVVKTATMHLWLIIEFVWRVRSECYANEMIIIPFRIRRQEISVFGDIFSEVLFSKLREWWRCGVAALGCCANIRLGQSHQSQGTCLLLISTGQGYNHFLLLLHVHSHTLFLLLCWQPLYLLNSR
jgi:hypothetical protein